MNASRRSFLRAATGLAAIAGGPAAQRFGTPFAMSLAGMAAMASQSSVAADASGPYRALVCLYMAGGNDSHNWVVPTDSSSYVDYAAARGELAWPAARLRPMTCTSQGSGRSFGMAEELQPLRDWYESGRLAFVANVGPLDRPTTQADFRAGRNLPSKLFSHNDQTSMWQSLAPEGAPSGWGGRMGDLLMAANRYPAFTAVSSGGNAVFLTGNNVTQYQVGSDGPVVVGALGNDRLNGSTSGSAALRRVLLRGGTNPYQAEYTRVMQRSLDTSTTLQAALASTGLPDLPNTPMAVPNSSATVTLSQDALARQLRLVARLISAAPGLGMRRQVFMVSIGGFDSHANQLRDQPVLMARVAQSVNWFLSALNGLGMMNNVTLFTASDFGRTLSSNGAGSDHGWGGHHLVAGGAVKGRNIYGRFPVAALGSADDVGSGRLLPSTSVAEYAAASGRWMGLSTADLVTVLPTLSDFPSENLEFI